MTANFADIAGDQAARSPDSPALWCGDRWYTYTDLNARAQQLAARLAGSGIVKGDRVSILALNHLAHIDLILAASKLGFIYAPLNYRLSESEQVQIARYLKPKLMLHDAQNSGLARATGVALQPLENYERWLQGATVSAPAPSLDAEDLHMLLLTGGSTGTPKAAMIPYRQVLANCVNTATGWGITASDCVIQATPCFHAAVNVFTTPLLRLGGRVVLMPVFDAGEYLDLAERHGATILFMVPTMFQMLAAHPRFASADLSAVRWAISGGAPCPPNVREAYARRGIRFKQGYGMTEAGVNCFMMSLEEASLYPEAVGHPINNTQAAIRRADGAVCADNEAGELTLCGTHVCAGYFEREAEWNQVYRDGWLWTGDLARRDAQGIHSIAGRSKEMFISGGENVFPLEVENALAQCAGVAECAVLGVPDAKWGEAGLAAVAPHAGAACDAASLRAELKTRLAGYKVPQRYLLLPALPKSGAGKISKPEIRKLYEQQCAEGNVL